VAHQAIINLFHRENHHKRNRDNTDYHGRLSSDWGGQGSFACESDSNHQAGWVGWSASWDCPAVQGL